MNVDTFSISPVPVTNAQYLLFVNDAKHMAPGVWEDGRPPRGKGNHPVVNVSWNDANAYCQWLSMMTGKKVSLPSEEQWEKAARGVKDQREYPWGDAFDASRCNCWVTGIKETTPVGIFIPGASPYGVLDMSGNVWEWTRSTYKKYHDDVDDGGKSIDSKEPRVVRGGSFYYDRDLVRCAFRVIWDPGSRGRDVGFRLVASPFFSGH